MNTKCDRESSLAIALASLLCAITLCGGDAKSSEDPDVERLVLRAAKRILEGSVTEREEALRLLRANADAAGPAREALLSSLSDPDPAHRELALLILARIGKPSAAEEETVRELVLDSNARVRAAAFFALGRYGPSTDDLKGLELDQHLSSESPRERLFSAFMLHGGTRDRRMSESVALGSLDALWEAARLQEGLDAIDLAEAIAEIGGYPLGAATYGLLEISLTGAPHEVANAAFALERIGVRRPDLVASAIAMTLSGDESASIKGLRLLGLLRVWTAQADRVVRRFLTDARPTVQLQAIRSASDLPRLSDDVGRTLAAVALGGGPNTAKAAIALSRHDWQEFERVLEELRETNPQLAEEIKQRAWLSRL